MQRAVKALAVGQFDRLAGGADDFRDIFPLDVDRAHVVRLELELAAVQALGFAGDSIAVVQVNDVGFFGPGGRADEQKNQKE